MESPTIVVIINDSFLREYDLGRTEAVEHIIATLREEENK